MGFWEAVRTFPKFKLGWHLNHPKVTRARFKKVEFRSFGDVPTWLEADGELLGQLPATITVMPAAVRFLVRKKA